MILGAMDVALGGLQRNQAAFAGHADRIASWGLEGATPTGGRALQDEMVGLLTARRGIEANLPVLRASGEMLGTLIDLHA